MHIYQLPHNANSKSYLKALKVDSGGITILDDKMHTYRLYISDLSVIAANILKQDALSIGADVATPEYTITHKKPFVDVILIANRKQIKALAKKELAQPFGLKSSG